MLPRLKFPKLTWSNIVNSNTDRMALFPHQNQEIQPPWPWSTSDSGARPHTRTASHAVWNKHGAWTSRVFCPFDRAPSLSKPATHHRPLWNVGRSDRRGIAGRTSHCRMHRIPQIQSHALVDDLEGNRSLCWVWTGIQAQAGRLKHSRFITIQWCLKE